MTDRSGPLAPTQDDEEPGESPLVKDYMTEEVESLSPEATVGEAAELIAGPDGHSGYPVCDRRHVEGFVSAADLLLADDNSPVFTVMETDILVAHPEMKVDDAARVILRSGYERLPVVDDAGNLVGIISNTDVVRSQIERATPGKVRTLRQTLANIHGVAVSQERREVPLAKLTPTQNKVYADELEGRQYELERGLAEPLIVIDNAGTLYLADGHHRVLAASRAGIETMDAYVIVLDEPVELGMKRTAEQEGLDDLNDIEVIDYARHPLVETTERLQ